MSRASLEFSSGPVRATGMHDSVSLYPDDDPIEEVARSLMEELAYQVDITIGDTTMHLAAWRDPDHWADDWVKLLEIKHDEVAEHVAMIIAEAVS